MTRHYLIAVLTLLCGCDRQKPKAAPIRFSDTGRCGSPHGRWWKAREAGKGDVVCFAEDEGKSEAMLDAGPQDLYPDTSAFKNADAVGDVLSCIDPDLWYVANQCAALALLDQSNPTHRMETKKVCGAVTRPWESHRASVVALKPAITYAGPLPPPKKAARSDGEKGK